MIRKLILSLCVGFCCLACEEALPDYNTTWSGVQFVLGQTLNPERFSYSFIGKEETRMMDTLWFTVRPQGLLPERNCRIRLEQYEGKEWKYIYGEDGAIADSVLRVFPHQAEAGIHYVAFDDADLVKYYRIPRGQNTVKIPVVLLRNDPELQKKMMVLKFGFEENDFFAPGYKEMVARTVQIRDFLTEPVGWWRANMGTYGQMKHRLMIQWTGEPWDEAYIKEFGSGDSAYRSYMRQWLRRKLKEENDKRLADPNIGDVYREENGTAVSF